MLCALKRCFFSRARFLMPWLQTLRFCQRCPGQDGHGCVALLRIELSAFYPEPTSLLEFLSGGSTQVQLRCVSIWMHGSFSQTEQSIFSSGWLCQRSYCHGAGVHRPSVNSGFSETAAWIQAKFCDVCFLFPTFFNFKFLRIFFVVVNMEPYYGIWNFCQLNHMGLEISKRYSSHSFHLMPAKLYEDIGYHGGIQAVTFLGNRLSFKNFVALWNFNMGVNGKT